MALVNLPGTIVNELDGNLTLSTPNNNPIVLVIGTATSGKTEQLYQVSRPTDASSNFGQGGTLIRGMYEVTNGGAANIRLFRTGATSAKLANIIANKVTITTVFKDDSTGTDYKILYVKATGQLTITRALDGTTVFFFDPANPSTKIDLNEISVSGTWAVNDGVNISSGGNAILLSQGASAGSGGDPAGTFTAGTDGTSPSRMEMFQNLYNANQLLENQQFDIVVPMDVYLDDANVMDMSQNTASGLWNGGSNAYPTLGTPKDVLGKVFVQEYQGQNYFWWLLSWDRGVESNNPAATATAQIFPSGIGSSTATADTAGVTLRFQDYHEVNFGYQLARFCYDVSGENNSCIGTIGVKPPLSFSLKDVSAWVGLPPVVSAAGVITTNGTGLMGSKFAFGRVTTGAGATKIPGLVINGVDGAQYGGMIACDTIWLDGVQQKDANNSLIDLGKYISLVSAQPILASPVSSSYVSTGAPIYAGMISALPADSAPTNKIINNVGLPYRLSQAKVDALSQRFVHFWDKPKGIVVADAPSGARPDSDYKRLSTVRIVKATVDAVRAVADPFLGESLNGARMAALDTAVNNILAKLKQAGLLTGATKVITATPDQRINGQATIELKLIPAFELRQITVTISLARE